MKIPPCRGPGGAFSRSARLPAPYDTTTSVVLSPSASKRQGDECVDAAKPSSGFNVGSSKRGVVELPMFSR